MTAHDSSDDKQGEPHEEPTIDKVCKKKKKKDPKRYVQKSHC